MVNPALSLAAGLFQADVRVKGLPPKKPYQSLPKAS
jgi:hypothetical protein